MEVGESSVPKSSAQAILQTWNDVSMSYHCRKNKLLPVSTIFRLDAKCSAMQQIPTYLERRFHHLRLPRNKLLLACQVSQLNHKIRPRTHFYDLVTTFLSLAIPEKQTTSRFDDFLTEPDLWTASGFQHTWNDISIIYCCLRSSFVGFFTKR